MWILWTFVTATEVLHMVASAIEGRAWMSAMYAFGACVFAAIAIFEFLDKHGYLD